MCLCGFLLSTQTDWIIQSVHLLLCLSHVAGQLAVVWSSLTAVRWKWDFLSARVNVSSSWMPWLIGFSWSVCWRREKLKWTGSKNFLTRAQDGSVNKPFKSLYMWHLNVCDQLGIDQFPGGRDKSWMKMMMCSQSWWSIGCLCVWGVPFYRLKVVEAYMLMKHITVYTVCPCS